MITTNKIQFTNTSYFKVLLQINTKKYAWLLILTWGLAATNIFKDELNELDLFYIIFSIVFPIYFIFYYWRFANSKENKIFFQERFYTVDEDKIVGFLADGTQSIIKNQHIIKFQELKECFLIYISKNQFLYFPKNALQSSEDEKYFRKTILEPLLLNKK